MFVQGWVVTDDMRKRGTDGEKETQINTHTARCIARSLAPSPQILSCWRRWAAGCMWLIHLSQGMLGKAQLLPADIDLSHTELPSLHGATHTDREGDLLTHI